MVKVIKRADMDYVDIGDLIVYSIIITNEETTVLTNLKLTDILPNQVYFTPNSVFEDGVLKPGATVETGVVLNDLNPRTTKVVQFQVAVKDFFPFQNIENKCKVDFRVNGSTSVVDSNILTTTLTKAWINIEKGGDAVAPLEGVVNYRIILKNVGNTKGTNLLVRDMLLSKLTLVEGSVLVNGVIINATLPEKMIIGDILSGETKILQFKAQGKNLVANESLENVSDCFYTYTTNPNDIDGSYGTFYSNFVRTNIVGSGILLEKKVLQDSIVSGNIGGCIITATNLGSSKITNLTIKDIFPNLLSFIDGSLIIDGGQSSGDISSGINIGDISGGAIRTIEFNFSTVSSDATTIVYNKAKAEYVYDLTRTGETYTESIGITLLPNPHKISVTKNVMPTSISSGETAIYTVEIKNDDTRLVENMYFFDDITVPLKYVEGSLKVNGQVTIGNLNTGISLGNLSGNDIYTINFQVKSDLIEKTTIVNNVAETTFIPSNGQLSNVSSEKVPLEIMGKNINTSIEVTEVANKNIARDGDEILYETTIKNNGEVDIKDLLYKVDIGVNQTFKDGSVIIDGVSYPLDNIVNGITIPKLVVGREVIIKYNTIVKAPLEDVINQNKYTLNYTYGIEENKKQITGDGGRIFIKGTSSPINEVQIIKTKDKEYASVGDRITYNITIKNIGMVDLENVIFRDTIAKGTVFVNDSIKISGIPITGDIELGIRLGNIKINEVRNLEFQVEVVKN